MKVSFADIPNYKEVLQGRLRIWYSFEDARKRVGEEEGGNKLHLMFFSMVHKLDARTDTYIHLMKLLVFQRHTGKLQTLTSDPVKAGGRVQVRTNVDVWQHCVGWQFCYCG